MRVWEVQRVDQLGQGQLLQEQVAMRQAEQQEAGMKKGRKPLEQLRQKVQRKVQLWLLQPPLQPSSLPEQGGLSLVVYTLVDVDYRTATGWNCRCPHRTGNSS